MIIYSTRCYPNRINSTLCYKINIWILINKFVRFCYVIITTKIFVKREWICVSYCIEFINIKICLIRNSAKIEFIWPWVKFITYDVREFWFFKVFEYSIRCWCWIKCCKICIGSIWIFWCNTKSTVVFIKDWIIGGGFVCKIIYKKFRWERTCWWSIIFFTWFINISRLHLNNITTILSRISIGPINWITIICPS